MVLDPNAFLKPYRPRMNRLPKPVKPFSYRHRVYSPISRKEEPEEEKHYWTVEQWEEWATNEFYNNPDTVLPEWFVKEMQEEEE